MAKKKTYTALAIDRLGKAAAGWLLFNALSDAFEASLAGFEIYLLSQSPAGSPLGPYGEFPGSNGIEMFTGLARLPVIVILIVTGFIVLKWVYRANRNAHAFAKGLQSDPPWAVGWFFVPVAWLWKPFQGMSETWRVSHDPVRWKSKFPPDLLRVWWGCWIVGSLLGTMSSRISFMASDTTGVMTALGLEALSSLVFIGAGLSMRRILQRVTARQTELMIAPPLPEEPVDPTQPWGAPAAV